MVGVINHSNWLTFTRTFKTENNYLRIVIYINIRLSSLYFSLHKDIINHRDILLVLFFNNNDIFWLINIYSDSSHSALKYLKDTEVYIWNLLIITGDFNIHNNLWDLLFPYYPFISDNLLIIADSYTPLTVTILIVKKNINLTKCSIIKDSNEKVSFIKDIIISIRNINMSNLLDVSSLDKAINKFTNVIEDTWEKNAKVINIIKHSKSWWNANCSRDLERYRFLKSLENWKIFYRIIKNTKQLFFDLKIQKIANKKWGHWCCSNH